MSWLLLGCDDRTTAPSDKAANDMSATIDGSGWAANQGTPYANFGAGKGSALVILGNHCYSCASGGPTDVTTKVDTVELLRLFIKPFTGPGSYVLKADPAATSALIRRSVTLTTKGGQLATTTVFLSLAGGRIDISTFDPLASRVSGTFQFDLTDSVGVRRRVRRGAFDVRLWDEPPPVTLRYKRIASTGQ